MQTKPRIYCTYGRGGAAESERGRFRQSDRKRDLCFFNQKGEFDLGAVSKQSTLLPCIAKQTGERARTAFLSHILC